MAKEPKIARPDMPATDAARLMASYDIGVVPIVQNDGVLVGLVTDRDLVVRTLAGEQGAASVPLAEIATRRTLHTVSPDATVDEAREMMAAHRIKRLMVTDGDEFVSVVSLGDVTQAETSMRAVGETLRAITASPATTEGTEDPPTLALPADGDVV